MTNDKQGKRRRPRKKSPAVPSAVEISGPCNVRHNFHLNENLEWRGLDPLEKFTVISNLGEGGSGSVALVEDKATKLKFAAKMIEFHSTTRLENDLVQELTNEINILRKCNHKNVVNYFGCFRRFNTAWLLMDFCAAGSIRALRKTKPFKEKHLFSIAQGVLAGLAYLHQNNIIHCDVKGSNVLVTQDGMVKLADFGGSVLLGDSLTSATAGTLLYMAPELLVSNAPHTKQSDTWSFGVTMFEAAVGQPPLHEERPMTARRKLTEGFVPSLPSKWSSNIRNLVQMACVPKPASRPTVASLLKLSMVQKANPFALKNRVQRLCKRQEKIRQHSGPPLSLTHELPEAVVNTPSSVLSKEGLVIDQTTANTFQPISWESYESLISTPVTDRTPLMTHASAQRHELVTQQPRLGSSAPSSGGKSKADDNESGCCLCFG
eukprot:m.125812 g.125812  ORF g.125812 m.125812 type:complete len:434 (+) comp23478_c0_seq1:92-1393(+)